MILRRTLIQAGAATALAAPALTGFAQQTITLRFHTFVSSTSGVWVNALAPWMDKVERESGNRIRFERFPSMQMGGTPAQLFDQARDGMADIVWTLPGNTPGRFPRSEVFELPFMMTNADATSRAYWDYMQAHAADEFRGVHTIAVHVHGPGLFHVRERAITRPDDLRGLRLRGPTRQITRLLGYLGATPVGMPLPQVPEALSRGVIDGTLIPWEIVPSVRVHEMVRFHSEFDPAVNALYSASFVMAMNQRRYEGLPPELKRVIDANTGLAASAAMGAGQQSGDAPARRMAQQHGNRINIIGAAETQEFRRQARQVEVEWVQDMDRRGFNGRELLANARRLIERHTATRA